MSYNPLTDFLGLLRQSGNSVSMERMPGLDYVLSALSRANLFQLSIGQTAPTSNQQSTAWLRPSLPSWVAEGTLFLWDAATSAYELATPALWSKLLSPEGYSFQPAVSPSNVIGVGTTLAAVQRAAPTATALVLPPLAAQWLSGRKLQLVDFSTGIVGAHTITITTTDGATIMQLASWRMISTPDQLAGLMLQPSPELNSWIIAP